MFQVPKSYSVNNQCEPSYSTLLHSGSGENGQASPDKGRLYSNLPPPASSGNNIVVFTYAMRNCFAHSNWLLHWAMGAQEIKFVLGQI
jgi:hypothetical protein